MNTRLACRMLVLMAGLMVTGVSWAANPNAGLRIEVIAAPNFVVDSNVGTPASKSPRSAFVGARFWNDTTTVMSNAVVSIGNYNNGTGSTPGIYPSRLNPTPVTGTYSLTHEGGSAGLTDAVRYLGNINPGEYVMVYWLLSYPLMDHTGTTPVFGSGPDPSDDLWLNYDIWGTVKSGAAQITAAQTTRATMRNEISAMANKIFPNTANQVPDEYKDALNFYAPAWTNVASDGSVGTALAAEGIWYQLGNVGQGYDCDNNLIPDHDAWLQPVGDPSLFDIGSYRLVKTHTLLIVKLKTGGEQVIMAEDQLYFKDIPLNTAVVGYVRYDFIPLKPDSTSQLTPYQEAASGSQNEKFNGDYGVTLGSIPKPPPPNANLTKSTTVTNTVPGGTIPYTVTYTNSGTVSMGNAEQGVPLVVQEQIPLGTRYVQNSASISNVLASGLSGYTIFYSTNNAVSWQTTEPAAYTNVTHIQWWLNDPLLPKASGIVRFNVIVDTPYRGAPLVVNTAGLSIGNNVPFKTATATTRISGNNFLGDLVWSDNGAGGGFLGNLLRDGAEAGLSNITVNLYYDSNTNGTVDSADLFIGATTSATNGAYLFTNLVDGVYLAIVDAADADLPRGYTLTTPGRYSVSLDVARTNANPMSVLTADFGFAPALSMTKRLTSVGPAYEGRPVNYSITVTNTLPGNGIGGGAPVEYTVYANTLDSANTTTGWLTPTNALGTPNGNYSISYLEKNPNDYLSLTGFSLTGLTGAITRVKVSVPVRVTPPWATQTFGVTLLTSAGVEFFRTNFLGAASLSTGTLVFDVTTNRVWQWTDFNSSAVRIQLQTVKQGGAPGGSIEVDAAAFVVTGTATYGGAATTTTLNPVPVVDTFDTRLLQFSSSSPLVSSVTTNGSIGTITWNNVGPIYPGGSKTLALNFIGLEPFNNTATIVTNSASITNAFFTGGLRANDAFDQAITNLEPTGVIGDYVWRDLDRNGQTNSGDYGIANVKVVLRPPANVDAGAGLGVPITNLTDSTGYYLFSGLISTGRYVVAVLSSSLPNGGVNVTNTWTEMSGTSNPTNVTVVTNLFPTATNGTDKHLSADFGYDWDFSIIDGTVWNDLNRSGTPTRDSGEFGLTNVTVYLVATNNPTVAIATNKTDSTGYFSFFGNYSGDYYVVVTTNTGPLSGGTTWLQTYDSDGLLTTNRVTVTASPNTTAHADFSYFQTGPYAIGDMLFFDWNNNGVIDPSDEGIPNIPLALYRDSNTNGVVDIGLDILLATTNTTVNGYYVFTNYPAGHYIVAVYQTATNFPVGYSLTVDPYGVKDGFGFLTITNSSNWNQDFGYLPFGLASIGDTVYRDLNADGIQSGLQETGITNVQVTLFVDLNKDGIYVELAKTNTLANGQYLFSNLPDGNYKVVVDAMSAAIPRDAFNLRYVPTTSTNVLVSIVGSTSVLTADFGFGALGAIGDTIFMDSNANGTQDWNEKGITNVTVNLYVDANSNGVYEVQELYGAKVTTTNGAYLFTALPAGNYIVVVDTNSPALAGMRLTAAPALDGQPMASTNDPAQYVQYPVTIQPGTSFMGADFGFQPPGVIGETVWIDTNGNGLRDSSELGLVDVALVLSNAMITVTNRTDVDGYYNFSNLADGTYWVRVLTNSVQFTGLVPTYDPDGTNTANMATSMVISNGLVTSVGGVARTNFNFSINFGYQYSGNNTLSGTVGRDGSPTNGVMGAGISGVSADEKAFTNQTVYLSMWRDVNTNGVLDAGETTQLATTQTDSNGDYQFTGLPSSLGAGTNRYVVSLSAPRAHLILTTVTGNTPALLGVPTTNSFGEIISAYQVVAIAPVITNIDFAFRDGWTYDFGDLPSSYSTLLSDTPEGASHRVLSTTNLYLGAGVSIDQDGQPSVTASLDSLDDGVITSGFWQNGLSNGTVQVTVGKGSGWLVGYIDFNQNGSFLDAGELIVSENVSTNGGNGAGVYTFAVDVPANSINPSSATILYSRFRLLPSEPPFPGLAFSGLASNGEVEDYRWDLGSVGDRLWIDSNGNGVYDAGEPPLENVRVFADANTNGVWNAGEPYALTGTNGLYGIGGFPAGTFKISVDTNTLPAGLHQTFDPDAVKDSQTTVTLTAGQVITTADFGYAYQGSISGSVLIDVNGNGVANVADTNAISGVTIELLTNGVVVATTVTSANGGYSFTNLMPGAYTVREIDLSGWYSTLDVSGANDNLVSVVLTSGLHSIGNDFYDSRYAALGDFVWEDANGNGQQDLGETGLSNVVVRLYNTNNVVIGVATSTVAGAYAFTNLSAGTYTVEFTPPANYLSTTSNVGDDALDSDPLSGTNRTAAVTLASGQTDNSVDAGFYAAASISGFVRIDLNGNGVADPGDTTGIAGVTVELLDAAANVVATASTVADGSYSFIGLHPGSYTVRETDLGGWYSTTDVIAPNDNLIPVTLAIGENSAGNNFYDAQRATFGDRVWNDLDGDGVQEAFEPGISGVRVYVDSDGSGTYNAGEPMATTAADGSYQIGALYAGSYTARVDVATLPVGMNQTFDLNGALDNAALVALNSNQTRDDVDFGYRSTAIYLISGQVLYDFDLSEDIDLPDRPVAGVTVRLYSDPNGDGDQADGIVLQSTLTTPLGTYLFSNITVGAYVVVETDLPHTFSVADSAGANDNRIPVVIVDADSIINHFLDAVDPAGYLYDVADGRIVPGGSISVSGAGAVIALDGSNGQYMFSSTNDLPTTFTITVNPPPGYILDPTRLPAGSSFTPFGGPTPTVLGSYMSLINTNYLVNYSAASNTYYFTFNLAPGDPPVINNNFPLVKASAIGDRVWEDLDGDGVQDTGEPGMTNVTVRLLDSGSNVLFTTVTDLNGAYSFTNLAASTYLIQVVPPAQYIFTLPNTSATNDVFDSDMEPSGFTAPITLATGVTDLSWDAGLTLPARIFGYAFLDLNTNLVRTVMVDYPIANMTVTLWRAGMQVASTLTAADGTGRYEFTNLTAGAYTVRFGGDTNQLEAVPASPPASTDPERNRAAVDGNGTIAISVSVAPGEGVTTATEPRNAGFIRPERPLSEFVSIRAYAASDGMRVEFTTAGEAGYGMITLWVWLDGAWVGLGSTPSMGFGSNTYSFNAPGLEAGKSYYFKVEDEVGYLYDLYDVTVQPFAMEMQLMERAGVRLTWNSIPGRTYKVYTTKRLGDAWTFVETVWADSDYASLEVTSDPQDRQRFFKVVMVRDEVIE